MGGDEKSSKGTLGGGMGQRIALSSHTQCMGGITANLWGPNIVTEQVSNSISEVNREPGGELNTKCLQLCPHGTNTSRTHPPPPELHPYFIIKNCFATACLTVCHGAVPVCIHTEDIQHDSFYWQLLPCSDSIPCLLGRVYKVVSFPLGAWVCEHWKSSDTCWKCCDSWRGGMLAGPLTGRKSAWCFSTRMCCMGSFFFVFHTHRKGLYFSCVFVFVSAKGKRLFIHTNTFIT